jgi:multidrug efflux pump subunit AcrA (membrane-fusion protein)
VAGATALFEIASLASVWIRVPVYVGDIGQVDRRQPAKAHNLADQPGGPTRTARPVAAPPSADPNAATADLYFELPNRDGALRPGQKVGVTLPLKVAEDSLAVPKSAIVHDIHGGTWVYENTSPQTFVRRPVEVRYTADSLVVLSRGPAPGTKVVTVGAAELFGVEFGAGK